MTDDNYKAWEFVFRWISVAGLLIGGWWTFKTYTEKRTDQFNQEQVAAKKAHDSYLLQRQTSLYLDAVRAAATLASPAKSSKDHDEARLRFDQLYFGELVVVEDRRVELAMIAFHNCLGGDCRLASETQHKKPIDNGGTRNIHNLSLDLGACVRSSLKDGWRIRFGEVEPAKTSCPYD